MTTGNGVGVAVGQGSLPAFHSVPADGMASLLGWGSGQTSSKGVAQTWTLMWWKPSIQGLIRQPGERFQPGRDPNLSLRHALANPPLRPLMRTSFTTQCHFYQILQSSSKCLIFKPQFTEGKAIITTTNRDAIKLGGGGILSRPINQ